MICLPQFRPAFARGDQGAVDPTAFVIVLNTNLLAESTTVLIPVNATSSGDRTIDWGDGIVETQNGVNPTHNYAVDGVYTVKMYGGNTTRLGATGTTPNTGWTSTLIRVVQWGTTVGWTNFQDSFRGCTQNFGIPNVLPSIASGFSANVTNMSAMFYGASAFNQPIESWNTSSVTDMSYMFAEASTFNQPIENWNTSAVTSMAHMFTNATTFNQNLENWSLKPSGVNMIAMLNNCSMGPENYSRTLIGWANSVSAAGNLPSACALEAIGRTYNSTTYGSGTYTNAIAARAYLVGATPNPAWTISGDSAI